MSAILPIDAVLRDEIVAKFTAGATIAELASSYVLPRMMIYSIVDSPDVRMLTAKRLATLGNRALMFKMQAFDHAEDALARVAEMAVNATDEGLRYKCNRYLIYLASLEPRKVVTINKHVDHGINDETREWFDAIATEAGVTGHADIVDAEIT